MSQKVQIYKNTNNKSAAYGRYFVRAVYDDKFITTDELADYIQAQATLKRSDCKAVLDELGGALKHFFELGQKVRLDNIGIFKVGVTSSASATEAGCTAANVKSCHVIFLPETVAVANGKSVATTRAAMVDGEPTAVSYRTRGYNHPVKMLQDMRFELTKDVYGSGMELATPADSTGSGSDGSQSDGGGADVSETPAGGDTTGGSSGSGGSSDSGSSSGGSSSGGGNGDAGSGGSSGGGDE